ncbi:yippee-like 5, partial [Aphelenchoides avenae]
MVRPFLEHLGGRYIFSCGNCQTYLSRQEEVISRSFRGASGRAFLFRKVVNVVEGPLQDRMMVTGRHFARDVSCKVCKTVLGWKYEFAYTRGQEYKE